MESPSDRGNWGSRLGFILAAAGSAVGLGNIWGFPTKVGQGGGAAFVLREEQRLFRCSRPDTHERRLLAAP